MLVCLSVYLSMMCVCVCVCVCVYNYISVCFASPDCPCLYINDNVINFRVTMGRLRFLFVAALLHMARAGHDKAVCDPAHLPASKQGELNLPALRRPWLFTHSHRRDKHVYHNCHIDRDMLRQYLHIYIAHYIPVCMHICTHTHSHTHTHTYIYTCKHTSELVCVCVCACG